jgi:hypothetical protein
MHSSILLSNNRNASVINHVINKLIVTFTKIDLPLTIKAEANILIFVIFDKIIPIGFAAKSKCAVSDS